MKEYKHKLQQEFFEAIDAGDLEFVKRCVEAGAGIDEKTNYNTTPLGRAIYCGSLEIVEYLIASGAKTGPDSCNSGTTAETYAHNQGRPRIAAFLETQEHIERTPEWSLIGASKLAHVEISRELHCQLTEIFNFASREQLTIAENLKTKTHSMTQPKSFNELPSSYVEAALEQFKKLGGVADEEFVLSQRSTIDKAKTLQL